MGINLIGQGVALHAGLELLVCQHLFGGNDARVEDVLIVIDIMQKGIQRLDALTNAAIQFAPLRRRRR